MNYVLLSVMSYTFWRLDRNRQNPKPYHNLQPPFFQAQVDQCSKTKEEHSVHFAKGLILPHSVNQ